MSAQPASVLLPGGDPAKPGMVFAGLWRFVNLLIVASFALLVFGLFWNHLTHEYLQGFADAIVPLNGSDEKKTEALLGWLAPAAPKEDTDKKDSKEGKQQEEKTTEDKPKAVIGSASVGIASFATQDTSFSISSYPLANSFILDCGSPIHICNDFSRFDQNTFQKPDRVDPVLTGDSCSYVEGYGEVQVNVNTPAGKQLFQLRNIAYIPGFHTNVISHRKLRQAGYRWDDLNLRIQQAKTSETAFYVEEIHDPQLAGTNLQTACGQMWRKSERCRRDVHMVRRQRNDLPNHEAREIGCTSQCWIPHHVQIREAGEAQGVT